MEREISHFRFFHELQALSFVDAILLYGSRGRGSAEARSDIDLAIICPTASPEDWSKVMQIIEDADTLLKIDCVRLDQLTNKNPLKQEIQHDGIILYTKKNPMQIYFEQVEKAIHSLEEAVESPMNQNRLNIDASIKRFEYSFELFWKLLKRIFSLQGRSLQFPKEILQLAYSAGLIDQEQIWLQMLQDRNMTVHTYDEEYADKVYDRIKGYCPFLRKSFNILVEKYDKQSSSSSTSSK